MIAKRTRNAKLGLLPRMDARPRKNGGYTYRYLTYERKYINLGHDRGEAIRKVLQMERRAPNSGTVSEMVSEYLESTTFAELSQRTQDDYIGYSKHILRVFGEMTVSDIEPPDIARYLRKERKDAPVQANREKSFLSSAFQFGIEHGYARTNPCRDVRRNKEKPRNRCPSWEDIESFAATAKAKGPSSHIIGLMAKFEALTGRRRAEFRELRKSDLTDSGIRIAFSKIRAGEADRSGLIAWTPALRQLLAEVAAIERSADSVFVFTTRRGQPYSESGFKAMWAKIMADWMQLPGSVRFTSHDLRAYYVTVMVERDENPETHANPATTRKVYDRRRVVKIKSSA